MCVKLHCGDLNPSPCPPQTLTLVEWPSCRRYVVVLCDILNDAFLWSKFFLHELWHSLEAKCGRQPQIMKDFKCNIWIFFFLMCLRTKHFPHVACLDSIPTESCCPRNSDENTAQTCPMVLFYAWIFPLLAQ